LLGVVVLAMAVLVGGLAALRRDPSRPTQPYLRTFAVVAAAAVALVHLLPEAISDIGWIAVAVAALGLIVPAVLERAIQPHHDHHHDAPTTALAMGYAAVIAHQAGEGAAIATLARTGALTIGIIAAIAAHTVPLAMVVAIRILEVKGERPGRKRATFFALAGVASATVAGAFAGNLVETSHLQAYQPWILALVAGLLLHALAHASAGRAATMKGKTLDATAGLAGLAIALFGVEEGGWTTKIPLSAKIAGALLIAAIIVARSFRAQGHAHKHVH
jgi:ZIP family zinc transporter